MKLRSKFAFCEISGVIVANLYGGLQSQYIPTEPFCFFIQFFFWWRAVVVRTIRLCQSCCKGGPVSSKFSSCPEHVLARLTEQKAKQE